MNTPFQKRRCPQTAVLLFFIATLLGCGDSQPAVTKMPPTPRGAAQPKNAQPKNAQPKIGVSKQPAAGGRRAYSAAIAFGSDDAFPVTYMENKGFYKLFSDTLKAKVAVQIHFDENLKLSANSPVLRAIAKDADIVNRNAFVQSLFEFAAEKDEKSDGRRALQAVFADELLERREAGLNHELPSGQSIEPATVTAACVIALLDGLEPTDEVVAHGPVKVSLVIDRGEAKEFKRAYLHFQPQGSPQPKPAP